jgi:cytochrome c5
MFIRRYSVALVSSVSLLAVMLIGLVLYDSSVYALPRLSAAEYKEDINGDGKIDIADVVALVIQGRDNPEDPQVDYNGNGAWSITDAIAMLINIRDGNLTPLEPVFLSATQLLDERCTVCHDLGQVNTGMISKDRSDWEVTVDGMIGRGTVLDSTEREILLSYLFGGSLLQQRCTLCHNLDQVNSALALKDSSAWDGTVTSMIGRGAQLDDAEKGILIDYLVELGEAGEL